MPEKGNLDKGLDQNLDFVPPPISPENEAFLLRLEASAERRVSHSGRDPDFTPPPISPENEAFLQSLAKGHFSGQEKRHPPQPKRRSAASKSRSSEEAIERFARFLGANAKRT